MLLLNRPTDRLQMTLECGPLKIVAKYDLLIGTWRTAIWHSKKSNFAVSSTDCSFKHFAVLSKIACMSTEFRCLDQTRKRHGSRDTFKKRLRDNGFIML